MSRCVSHRRSPYSVFRSFIESNLRAVPATRSPRSSSSSVMRRPNPLFTPVINHVLCAIASFLSVSDSLSILPRIRTVISESYVGQCSLRVYVGRDADFAPGICLGRSRFIGLFGILNSIAAYKKMGREVIAFSEPKDYLGHFDRVARLPSPVGAQRVNYGAHGGLIIRQQVRCLFIGAGSPVCAHSTRFERANSYAERSHLLGKGFGKSPDRPLGGVIRRAPGPGQTPTHGRNLEDAAALLLTHDRKCGAGHVDYAVEVGIDNGLESFRTQLLEGRNITIARVVHHDIKPPERIYSGLHGRIGRILVGHIQGGSADLVAVLLHQIVEATGIASCCHEASARCEDRFSDVTAQTASASRY